jgi:hypothetical protein
MHTIKKFKDGKINSAMNMKLSALALYHEERQN